MTEAVHNAPSALDEAVDRYLAHLRVERGLLDATLEAYARDLREYVEWLSASGIARLSEVTEPTVLQHLGALQIRGLSRASQARHLAAVRGLHKFANAEGLAPSDPSEGVEATRIFSESTTSTGCSRSPLPRRRPAHVTRRCWKCSTRAGCASRSWSGFPSAASTP